MHSKNNWDFLRKVYFSNNWALFTVHMSSFYNMEPRHIGKSSNRIKQQLY